MADLPEDDGFQGVFSAHPEKKQRVAFVAPTHAKEHNVIQFKASPVACALLPDAHFEFDSSFVKPQVWIGLKRLEQLRRQYPGSPLTVYGHADPVGDDSYNKVLSGRRAKAIYALLVHDPKLWEELYKNPHGRDDWGLKSVQQMLTSNGFDTGRLDGKMDDKAKEALKAFKKKAGLGEGADVDAKTREKLFEAYMDFLYQKSFTALDKKKDFIAQNADKDGKGDYQGCGEFNPILLFSKDENDAFNDDPDKTERNVQNAPNRRVLVFLFKPGTKIDPAKWPCPKAKDGISGCEKRLYSDQKTRRSFQEKRREHKTDKTTFGCRFYDFLAMDSPCEAGIPASIAVNRLEFHPVRPVPPDASLPPRPPVPAGDPAPVTNTAAATVSPGDPINIIPNPSVIPILTKEVAEGANGKDLAAKIEFTFYRPSTLAFTDDDPRLVWSVVSLDGKGAVSFLGTGTGLKVLAYGTAEGEVRLDVKYLGAVVASFRALVMKMKQIPCRFNILRGPTAASKPRSSPENIRDHLALANRFLRQIGLELVLDKDTSTKDGAVASSIPGIFTIDVAANITQNVPSSGDTPATLLNYRPDVMNFAYIVSEDRANVLGAASDYPASTAGTTIDDEGTPSTSWIVPSGILPDAASKKVTMTLLAARQRAGHPKLFAMYVTDIYADGTTIAGQRDIAITISHEFGHILNLGHRVEQLKTGGDATPPVDKTKLSADGAFWDGLTHPPSENIMKWAITSTINQDFDIIQARAVHKSPLVPV